MEIGLLYEPVFRHFHVVSNRGLLMHLLRWHLLGRSHGQVLIATHINTYTSLLS